MSSCAAGCTAAAAMSSATWVRSSRDPSSTSVWSARGRARSRRCTSTITPNAPNPPAASLVRSYPATFFITRPPLCTRRPSPDDEGDAEQVVAHGSEALSQRSRGGGRHDRAEAAAGEPGRVECEPGPSVRELLAQEIAADARLDRRREILWFDGGDVIEAPGGECQVDRGVGGEPAARAFDPDVPAFF